MKEFKGTRTIQVLADNSNFNNYLNGGRDAFNDIIRINQIDWLTIELEAEEVTLNINLSFAFDSYQDYLDKVSILLGYSPVIIHEENTYIEGFSTKDLVNFLVDDMQGANMYLNDTENIEIFVSGESKIEFEDGTVLEAENERIKQQENSDVSLSLKRLKIDTSFDKEENLFTRKMEFEIETKSDSTLNSMKKSFINRCKEENVEYKNEETRKFTVEFSRSSEKDLASTTMILLNTASNIGMKEQYENGNKVQVTYSEYLDLQEILNEDAEFSYTFDVSDFEKVRLVDGANENAGFTLEDNIIKVEEPKSAYKFSYQKDFEFDKVEIITDFSNDWYITRTFRLRARTIIAQNVHEEIKKSLENGLPDGTTLNIYDEGAYRYYDIVIKGNVNQINSLTAKITDGEANLKVSQMLLPFMPSKVEDTIQVEQICSYVENYNNIEQRYIFKQDTKLPDREELVVEITDEGAPVVIQNGNVSITYKNFDKILFAKVLILVIIVVVVFAIIKHKIKKLGQKIKEKKAAKKGEKSGE
ncbi:MAG: hypothetical protein IJ867_07255 [Clostridia bacterium]|nr:hypothetical protein [Clostridia bacterium]